MTGPFMSTNVSNYMNFSSQNLTQLYDNERDRKRHMAYMTSIADEKHRDISEVVPSYENILRGLRNQARVHDYLNIFVAKKCSSN